MEERNNLCIHFAFDSIKKHSDPWVFRGVNVTAIDWTTPKHKGIANTLGVQPMYQIAFGDIIRDSVPIRPILRIGCEHENDNVPQWPWVIAQLCEVDNVSPWISMQRLVFLLAVIQNSSPVSPLRKWLNTFAAPKDMSEYPWSISRVDEWQSKMGRVLCF